jgi:hypothetical protein
MTVPTQENLSQEFVCLGLPLKINDALDTGEMPLANARRLFSIPKGRHEKGLESNWCVICLHRRKRLG